jgi:ribonuclease HII
MAVDNKLERKHSRRGLKIVGVDEVGRGAWAGPVTVGVVLYCEELTIPVLNDSKKLNEKQRNAVYSDISALSIPWAVGECSSREIDKYGLSKSLHIAALRAFDALAMPFDIVLLDGNYDYINLNSDNFRVETHIKGDGISVSMAAASVVAKVTRDHAMVKRREARRYQWTTNKGYATLDHQKLVKEHGLSSLHRKSVTIESR